MQYPIETTVYHGPGGYYVEFYREDARGDGWTSLWYGSRGECEALAKLKKLPRACRWRRVEGWRTDTSPGSAAWCETYGDNH